jgi:hypothetical protein
LRRPDEVRRTRQGKDDAGGHPVGQIIQVGGALLILVAYVLSQAGKLNGRSPAYLWLNLIGSSVLAVDGVIEEQWGFALLEGAWAIVSAWGVVGLFVSRSAPPVAH